jgi:hypothetical protein
MLLDKFYTNCRGLHRGDYTLCDGCYDRFLCWTACEYDPYTDLINVYEDVAKAINSTTLSTDKGSNSSTHCDMRVQISPPLQKKWVIHHQNFLYDW